MAKTKEISTGGRERDRGRLGRRSPVRQRNRERHLEHHWSPSKRGPMTSSKSNKRRSRTRSRSPIRRRQNSPKKLSPANLDTAIAEAQQKVAELTAKKNAQKQEARKKEMKTQDSKASSTSQLEGLRKDLELDPSILSAILQWTQSLKQKTDPPSSINALSHPHVLPPSVAPPGKSQHAPANVLLSAKNTSSVSKSARQDATSAISRPNVKSRHPTNNSNRDKQRQSYIDSAAPSVNQPVLDIQHGASSGSFMHPSHAHVNPAFLPKPMSAATRAQPPGLYNPSQKPASRPPPARAARQRPKPAKDFRVPGQRRIGDIKMCYLPGHQLDRKDYDRKTSQNWAKESMWGAPGEWEPQGFLRVNFLFPGTSKYTDYDAEPLLKKHFNHLKLGHPNFQQETLINLIPFLERLQINDPHSNYRPLNCNDIWYNDDHPAETDYSPTAKIAQLNFNRVLDLFVVGTFGRGLFRGHDNAFSKYYYSPCSQIFATGFNSYTIIIPEPQELANQVRQLNAFISGPVSGRSDTFFNVHNSCERGIYGVFPQTREHCPPAFNQSQPHFKASILLQNTADLKLTKWQIDESSRHPLLMNVHLQPVMSQGGVHLSWSKKHGWTNNSIWHHYADPKYLQTCLNIPNHSLDIAAVEYVLRHLLFCTNLVYNRRGIPNDYKVADLFREPEMTGPWTPQAILQSFHEKMPAVITAKQVAGALSVSADDEPLDEDNLEDVPAGDTITISKLDLEILIAQKVAEATGATERRLDVLRKEMDDKLAAERTATTNRVDELLLTKVTKPDSLDGPVLDSITKKQATMECNLGYIYSLFSSQLSTLQIQMNIQHCLSLMDHCFPTPMTQALEDLPKSAYSYLEMQKEVGHLETALTNAETAQDKVPLGGRLPLPNIAHDEITIIPISVPKVKPPVHLEFLARGLPAHRRSNTKFGKKDKKEKEKRDKIVSRDQSPKVTRAKAGPAAAKSAGPSSSRLTGPKDQGSIKRYLAKQRSQTGITGKEDSGMETLSHSQLDKFQQDTDETDEPPSTSDSTKEVAVPGTVPSWTNQWSGDETEDCRKKIVPSLHATSLRLLQKATTEPMITTDEDSTPTASQSLDLALTSPLTVAGPTTTSTQVASDIITTTPDTTIPILENPSQPLATSTQPALVVESTPTEGTAETEAAVENAVSIQPNPEDIIATQHPVMSYHYSPNAFHYPMVHPEDALVYTKNPRLIRSSGAINAYKKYKVDREFDPDLIEYDVTCSFVRSEHTINTIRFMVAFLPNIFALSLEIIENSTPRHIAWKYQVIYDQTLKVSAWFARNYDSWLNLAISLADASRPIYDAHTFEFPCVTPTFIVTLHETLLHLVPNLPNNFSNTKLHYVAAKLVYGDASKMVQRIRKTLRITINARFSASASSHPKKQIPMNKNFHSRKLEIHSLRSSYHHAFKYIPQTFARQERPYYDTIRDILKSRQIKSPFSINDTNDSFFTISPNGYPSCPIPNFCFKYKKALHCLFLPKPLTIEQCQLFQHACDSFTLSDAAKALVTEDKTIQRPKDTDGIRSNGYFDFVHDRDPPLPPKFKRIYHYHLQQLESQADTRRQIKADLASDLNIDFTPPSLPPRIKLLSVNLNSCILQLNFLNELKRLPDIVLLQELNVDMPQVDSLSSWLPDYKVFHHTPVYEKRKGSKDHAYVIYSMILVRTDIKNKVELITDVPAPATTVRFFLDNEVHIVITSLYITLPGVRTKNEALNIMPNQWFGHYEKVLKEIARFGLGTRAIFAGDINMDYTQERPNDNSRLRNLFGYLFVNDQYKDWVEDNTFYHGNNKSRIDIVMTSDIEVVEYKAHRGRHYAINDGHDAFELILNTQVMRAKSVEYRTRTMTPTDTMLATAWWVTLAMNADVIDELYKSDLHDIEQHFVHNVQNPNFGVESCYSRAVLAMLESVVRAVSPMYTVKVVKYSSYYRCSKYVTALENMISDCSRLSLYEPKYQEEHLVLSQHLLHKFLQADKVGQILKRIGPGLHKNDWRVVDTATPKPSDTDELNNTAPDIFMKQFVAFQSAPLFGDVSKFKKLTWPTIDHPPFSGKKMSFNWGGDPTDYISNIRAGLLKCTTTAKGQNSEITPQILRRLPFSATTLYQRLSQTVVGMGVYPEPFSHLKAVGISKGCKNNTNNILKKIRVIAIGKCLDTLIQRQVECAFQKYLIKHGLLKRWQNGFRRSKGTSTLLAEVMLDICKGDLKNTPYIILLSFDAQNAFGTVHHKVLLEKLQLICERNMYLYFKGLLEGRSTTMTLNGKNSAQYHLPPVGVPQGQVMSPILFTFLLSGIETVVDDFPNACMRLYADDISCVILVDDLPTGIIQAERICQLTIDGLDIRGIQLNPSKSFAVTLHLQGNPDPNRALFKLNTSAGVIKESKALRLLGIDFHSNLSFVDRYHTLYQKIQSNSGLAVNLTTLLDHVKCVLWYKSKNYGLFNYSSEILPLFTDAQYKALDLVASKPMYDIFGLHGQHRRLSSRILHLLGRMPSLKDWHCRQILSFASKVLCTNNPKPVADFIRDHLFYTNSTATIKQPFDVTRADFRADAGWDLIYIPSGNRPTFFPNNLALLLPMIPQRIRNLFGSYQFDNELKTHISAKCPHSVGIVHCDGCDNDRVAATRLRNRVHETACPLIYNSAAKAIEFTLAEDLPDDIPFIEFNKRLDKALLEAKNIVAQHAVGLPTNLPDNHM